MVLPSPLGLMAKIFCEALEVETILYLKKDKTVDAKIRNGRKMIGNAKFTFIAAIPRIIIKTSVKHAKAFRMFFMVTSCKNIIVSENSSNKIILEDAPGIKLLLRA